jgi:3-oxoacyl-[acyl-carrier-protein] synthase II
MIDARRGRRVVVTGLGVVAPCGIGVDEFWTGLAKPVEPAVVRRVADFDPESVGVTRVHGRRMDRFTLFGVAAAAYAMVDAGLTTDLADRGTPADLDGQR